MRISQLPTLAACLSIGSLAAWAAYGSMHDVAAAAPLAPGDVGPSQCLALPVTGAGASPTASASGSASASASASPTTAASSAAPTDLCVSVQASNASVQAGQAASWTVQVWAQNGPVIGVTVTLTGSIAGQQPTFTGKCPGGDGSNSCVVGDLATDVTASSYQMQAQIAIPSGIAAGTSVTLTATADATPSLPTAPVAATAVNVTAAPSPSGQPSTTPAATHAPTPAATPVATPAATAPAIGPIPTLVSPVTPQTLVTALANPGSITGLLPVVAPAGTASPTSPVAGFVTSPAADNPGSPVDTADRAGASRSVFVVPVSTAEALGIVILLIFATMATRLRAANQMILRVRPGRASRRAHGKTSERSDSPKKTR